MAWRDCEENQEGTKRFAKMKTKKQVIDDFVRLQKRYLDIDGFATVRAYNQEGSDYWVVDLTVTAFKGNEIVWDERVSWTRWSNYSEMDEANNIANVEDFEKRMEERLK